MEENFVSSNPVLPVKNVKQSAEYYQSQLGFSIAVLWRNPSYAVLRRGNVFIELGEGRPEHVGSGVCYIHVNDVDAIYREYCARKLNIVGDLEDRDYGNRDFRVKDDNGNLLIIGSSLSEAKRQAAG